MAMAREQNERQNNTDAKECVVFSSTVGSNSALENHVAKVALNTPPHFSSTDSVSTILSSTGSIPSLQGLSRYNSRANSFSMNDASLLLDAAAAALSPEEYMFRRATLDLGHLSRNHHSSESLVTFMATVPETKSPENEAA